MCRNNNLRDSFVTRFRSENRANSLRIRSGAGFATALAALLFAGNPVPVEAAQGTVTIELNRLQEVDTACRLSLVYTNMLAAPVETMMIETVLFNADGGVERFLVLKSRPLPPKKIRVQQFDISDFKCSAIGSLLLNDVKECKAGSLTRSDCLDAILPTSRLTVPFISTTASGQKGNADDKPGR